MKHLRIIAALTLFMTVTMASAQSKTTNWPQLRSVQEVAARMSSNIETHNKTPFYFAETLAQTSVKLSQSNVPPQYASKEVKQNISDLVAKTAKLSSDSKSKVAQEELITQFEQIKTLISKIATPTQKQ